MKTDLQAVKRRKSRLRRQISWNKDPIISRRCRPIPGMSAGREKFRVDLYGAVQRAAIEGGLAVKTAKEMEMRYISETERCETVTKLKSLKNMMLDDFVHKVRESKENPMISKTTQECCDYIRTNVLRPLTVEEVCIAKRNGIYNVLFYEEILQRNGDQSNRLYQTGADRICEDRPFDDEKEYSGDQRFPAVRHEEFFGESIS